MTSQDVRRLFRALAACFEEEKDHLGALDAKVGDGDHGAAMVRGFAKASEAVVANDSDEVGELLTAAGRAFMNGTGGASGPLFASLFLEIGKAAVGSDTLTVTTVADGVQSAVALVRRIGRSELGDKTMLDALAPAAEALAEARDEGRTILDALALARDAAEKGRDATREMSARRGRAHYVEGAGKGYMDPGAVSIALVFTTAHAVVKEVA